MLPSTTMIRHASLSGPVTAISVGVHGATTGSCLMTSASFPLLVTAGFLSAGSDAVYLPAIAPPTDNKLHAAARAQKHPARNFIDACGGAGPARQIPTLGVAHFRHDECSSRCTLLDRSGVRNNGFARSPPSFRMILAGRGAAVKAGLRPPPSAAIGLDCGSPPSRRWPPSVRRLRAPGCSRRDTRRHTQLCRQKSADFDRRSQLCAPNPPWSAWRAQTGAASGRQGRSREAGPRQRQPLRAEAGPVHCCQQQKDMPPDGLASKAGNHRPHRTLSNSRFGRHETGSAIQRLMSDSCHPVPLVLILS